MTDEERKRVVDRLDAFTAGLDLAIKIIEADQRYRQQSQRQCRQFQRAVAPKKDLFDRAIDFVTLDWMFK